MNQIATTEQKQLTPSQQFRSELDRMSDQFVAALPSHIKPEKFQRVVMTAVISDPAVLKADRKSLMEAAIRAAQDGLLPDKREGAFVVFGNIVQWMPMVGGIIKRVHQSGDIKMLTARVVYGGDHFRTWIDDTGEHIEYEPAEDQDTSIIRRVFAMATTTDGAVYVEPLSAKDVEKIRNVSRSKNKGPWADWWEEMAKKSAIRRLAKRLPLSVDIHDLIQRDNAMFDLSQDAEPRMTVSDRLKAARNITPVDHDDREGFDASFSRSDAASTLTSEILDNDNTNSGSAPEPDTADAPPSPASAEAGDTVPSSPASQPLDNDLRTHLMDFARKALRTAEDDLSSEKKLDLIEDMIANYREVVSEAEWGKLSTIKVSIQAVLVGKRTIDQARTFIAGDLLGCDATEIGGDA
ncbi:hypothetical protein G6M02_07910 [Agrobacterium rhizogenes]|nr:hypothetical protein [Rhizobium rhizogenes]